MKRLAYLVLGLASTWGWAQSRDAVLDFSLVVPPAIDRHKIVQPVVQWVVKPEAADHCAQIQEHDGFAVWQEGCVYWSRAQSTCTIVTTGRTSHSQIGRLFLLCLTNGEPT